MEGEEEEGLWLDGVWIEADGGAGVGIDGVGMKEVRETVDTGCEEGIDGWMDG